MKHISEYFPDDAFIELVNLYKVQLINKHIREGKELPREMFIDPGRKSPLGKALWSFCQLKALGIPTSELEEIILQFCRLLPVNQDWFYEMISKLVFDDGEGLLEEVCEDG